MDTISWCDFALFMPFKFQISVIQVGKSLEVTIQVEVARHLKIEKGDTVEMWLDNHHIITEKKQWPQKGAISLKTNFPSSIPQLF